MKKILFIILFTTPFLGFGQLYHQTPKCDSIKQTFTLETVQILKNPPYNFSEEQIRLLENTNDLFSNNPIIFEMLDLNIDSTKFSLTNIMNLEIINFDDMEFVEVDGVYSPMFPEDGIVIMCGEEGDVSMEMLFLNDEGILDVYYEDWGIKFRPYDKEGLSKGDVCYNKELKPIECVN